MAEYSVLIIDDDIWMQRIVSKTLLSYGFKTSYLASNGFDGIALAVEHIPTLIVLDILMPELSGHLTLKILKRIKSTQHIPVLMVSAMSDVENLGLAVKSGTAGFISKPFTKATLYDKLLDIFGKEKLELIAAGEHMEPVNNDYIHEIVYSPDSNDKLISTPSPNQDYLANLPDLTSEDKAKAKQEQLLHHYQEDEKRSIESIKKMLLKPKK